MADSEAKQAIGYEFHLEEWKSLRAAIAAMNHRLSNLETGGIVAIGAYYAWFVQYMAKASLDFSSSMVLVFIPIISTLIIVYRVFVIQKSIDHASEYIQRIESNFAVPPLEGWETYFMEAYYGKWHWQRLIFWSFVLIGQGVAVLVLLRFVMVETPVATVSSNYLVG
jgi:hypothetical protein